MYVIIKKYYYLSHWDGKLLNRSFWGICSPAVMAESAKKCGRDYEGKARGGEVGRGMHQTQSCSKLRLDTPFFNTKN